MATTTDTRSAAELRAEKETRVAAEQAKLDEARERVKAEAPEPPSEPAAASNGTGRGSQVDAQDGLFDQVVENAELEAALEDREKRNNSKNELTRQYKEAHEKVKGMIAVLDIEEDVTVRVGRFRVTRTKTEGGSVAFDRSPGERLTIVSDGD